MKKILALVSLALVLTTLGLAQEKVHTSVETEGPVDIEQGELKEKGLLSDLTGLLSFSGVDDTYEPGEEIDVEITADTEEEYDTENAKKVVSIYKCADSSCDTPPPIDSSSEDSCSKEEWSPDYDDCISQNVDEVSFSTTQTVGTSWTWDASFSGLEDDAQYILVGYVHSSEKGIVTDVSEEKFKIEESTTDSDGDGVIDSKDECPDEPGPEENDGCPEPEPNIQNKGVDFERENGQVKTTVELENTGDGDMSESNIVEMQVRPEGEGVLSLLSSTSAQDTCDDEYPENVHKEFKLESGESQEMTLTSDTDNLEKGRSYEVYLTSVEDCYPDNDPVEPFYDTGEMVGDFTSESEEVFVEQSSTDQTVTVTDDEVVGEISLKNTGNKDMEQEDLIEMQVVEKGEGLMSFLSFTSAQDTCDQDNPQNVNRKFKIDAGDTEDIELSVDRSDLESGKSYDVWMVSRDECGGGPVEPHGTGVKADTVTLEDSGSGGGNESSIPVVPVLAGIGISLVAFFAVKRGV